LKVKGDVMQSKAENVDQYLAEVPRARFEALEQLRKMCLEILEGYQESMEYGMPSYKQSGNEVEIAFASQKNYISLYVLKQDVLDKHRESLKGLNLGKGCIRYSKPEKIDFEIVKSLLTDSYRSDSDIC
jgi:uncharacterized protein YdhG (YjbR/CyaY superfamily)